MELEDFLLDLHPQYIADKPDGEVNQLFLCGALNQQWARSMCNDAGDDDPELRARTWHVWSAEKEKHLQARSQPMGLNRTRVLMFC